MTQNQFDCIASDLILQKYRLPSKYEGENDGELELAEVPYYFPSEK